MSCWTIAAAKAPCDCGALPTFSTLGELCPLGDGSDLHDFGLCVEGSGASHSRRSEPSTGRTEPSDLDPFPEVHEPTPASASVLPNYSPEQGATA